MSIKDHTKRSSIALYICVKNLEVFCGYRWCHDVKLEARHRIQAADRTSLSVQNDEQCPTFAYHKADMVRRADWKGNDETFAPVTKGEFAIRMSRGVVSGRAPFGRTMLYACRAWFVSPSFGNCHSASNAIGTGQLSCCTGCMRSSFQKSYNLSS